VQPRMPGLLLLLACLAIPAVAAAEEPFASLDHSRRPITLDEIPGELRPWIAWALDGEPTYRCAWDQARPLCDWPGELALEVAKGGARFSFFVEMLERGEVALPGSARRWPEDVRANGRPIAVLSRGGVPTVRLPAGRHALDGRIVFGEIPESIEI